MGRMGYGLQCTMDHVMLHVMLPCYVMLSYVMLSQLPFPTCDQQGSKPAKKPATSKVSKDTSWLVSAGAMSVYVCYEITFTFINVSNDFMLCDTCTLYIVLN